MAKALSLVLGGAFLGLLTGSASAQTGNATFTGTTYSQNFDTLPSTGATGTFASLPTGVGVVEQGTNANTTFTVGTGSSNSGDTYDLGAASATDRALGGLQSGSLFPTFGVRLQNNTGGTITSLAISYNGEQYRRAVLNRLDALTFQYSTTATAVTGTGTTIPNPGPAAVPTGFTAFPALDYNATQGAVVTTGGLVSTTPVSGTITGLNIAPGGTIILQFADYNASGADDVLAVDDLNVTATLAATPTPSPSPSPTPSAATTGAIISEYRPSGTAGASDEYVEVYNASGAAINISGWTLSTGTALPGTTAFTFPANTTIPTRGHYLVAGTGYSLTTYGAPDNLATPLAADALPDTGGVALNNATGTLVDAVGNTGIVEGTPLPAAPGAGVEYAYVRKVVLGGTGDPNDTNDNSADFFLVSTASTSGTGVTRQGAPGPEGLTSPIQSNGSLTYTVVGSPSRVGAPNGTLTLRRRITNNSPLTITSIRLRAVDISAGDGGAGIANTPITTGNGNTSPANTGIPAPGSFVSLTLEAPSGTLTSGVNTSLTTGTISVPPGGSVDVEYTLTVVAGGNYRVTVSLETITAAAGGASLGKKTQLRDALITR